MPHSGRARHDPIMRRGRSGRPWRRVRLEVLAEQGDLCHVCGHAGANAVDHLRPLSEGGDPLDKRNLAPVHCRVRCPVCGRMCNQERAGVAPKTIPKGERRSQVW